MNLNNEKKLHNYDYGIIHDLIISLLVFLVFLSFY